MVEGTKIKDIDITKTGPMTFRDLQEANQEQYTDLSPEFQSFSMNIEANTAPISLYDARAHGEQLVQSPLEESATPWGKSMFDDPTATEEQFRNLGDVRANNQPWYAKVSAGLAKGAVLAGTTFLDGTVGLVLGGIQAGIEHRASALYDNAFSKAMKSVNEAFEELIPNYYTEAELTRPWYENIFTANFLGDKFIKNLGFTVGAFYSGWVVSAALKATKLPKLIGIITKSAKAPKIISSAVGATISAVNEGRIEALNNSTDWFELQKAQLDDQYSQRLQYIKNNFEGTELYDQLLKTEEDSYNEALVKLSEDRLKMGNMNLLMNLPILLASNIIQLGKLYARGFKTARRTGNIVGKAGQYTVASSNAKAIGSIVKGALSEGTEEISQSAASTISGLAYEQDINNFYRAKIDPEAEQQTIDWMKAFAQGINETVNDSSSWEEFFIGTLTGALGMPRFRGIRNSEGKLQSPITIEGGAINEWKDYKKNLARTKELADYLNRRVQSPEFINYYQGLIRHNKYQDDMNKAVEANNEFEFKNAEHAQLLSDIMMFDNAGKLEDLTALISSAYDTSDENLSLIVENTTSTLEDGSQVGPFVDKNGNPTYSTPEGKQEMIDKLTQAKDEILNTINSYIKIKDDIDIRTDEQLSDEQLEELTWLKSQISNWQSRASQLSSEVKPTISTVLGSMSQLADTYSFIKTEEGKAHAGLSDAYKEADESERQIRKNIQVLEAIRGLDDKAFAYLLSADPTLVDTLKSVIENPLSGIDADDVQAVKGKIDDIVKLVSATGKYNTKLKEYLENPTKLQEDITNATETIAREEVKKKSDNLKSKLMTATNLSEFRQALNEEVDDNLKSETLKSLEEEGNEIAKNYREVHSYNNDVQRALNSLDEDLSVKEDAFRLFQDQFKNSSNLEEIANPNSIYIDNTEALYDDSLTPEENIIKFQRAQYTLLRAMTQINNENKFKDRFSPGYKKPMDRTVGIEKVENPDGTINFYSLNKGRRVTGQRGGLPTTLTQEEANDNGLLGSDEEGQVFDIKINKFRGINYKGEYVYDINYKGLDDSGNTFTESATIKVSRSLHESRGDDRRDTTGDSGTSTIPPVNTGGLPVTTYEPPVGNVTSTQVRDENKETNNRTETPQSFDSKQKGRRPYYRPSIPELHIQASKEGDFRPFNVVVAEREKGVNFDEIYNYLKNNGAFTYVNEGNLKAGDELGFMIDPSFNNQTIFIVDKRNNQIVGSLDESQYSVDRYEGLAGLEEKIKAEFAQRSEKDKRFIATPTTRVSQVMVGKIPYGTEERSLANIPNVSGEGRTPIFGIIKNGTLSTNNKLNDSLIIKPVDMSQKEGRMYLLIPNAAGKYSPAAIRVKHFNREEFNPEDIEVQNTQVFKAIQESINALSNSLSEEDLNDAVKSLKSNLYTGDLHIDWFTSDRGNGIRFTKIQRDSQGNEIYEERGGKRFRKEEVRTIFLTEKWDANTKFSIIGNNEIQTSPVSKSSDKIGKEITDTLLDFNLPIQVNLGMLNRGGYNNMLINSNILTSNISDARVLGSWFTTDYFDNEGNLKQAISPINVVPQPARKVETPVGGKEGVISGIKINYQDAQSLDIYDAYVDLKTSIIRDLNGRDVTSTISNDIKEIMFDLAWAQSNFGDSTQSSMMIDNKVLTPSGKILDRNNQWYIEGEEAQEIKDKIAGRERTVGDSKRIIAQIAENQKKVDKTRTDGEFYYILEDDGQYHKYERVHSRLGSNWIESKKQTEALKDISVKLAQLSNDVSQYNNYLKHLNKYWKVTLDAFSGKTDINSRNTIINIIRDSMNGTNSQRALNAGTAVDSVIRNFFTSNDVPVKPDNMSEKAFIDLITSLTEIRSNIEARGERFLTDNIVLFQKYPDGTRVAGEVDILSIDADGNFKIYDVKTSRYSFYDFTDRYGHKVNYFNNKSATQVTSPRNYYTLQLSAYKNLFESQYNTPITTLAILPFVLNYNKDIIDGAAREKGIIITYNPNVNVPLAGAVKASETTLANSTVPVFNSALETQDPINNVLPEYSLEDSKVGYFMRDSKLHKSYLSSIGQVNGIEVYMAKVPIITKGFGRQGEEAHVASNSYIAVFPNGNSITIIKNDPMTMTEQQAKDTIKKILEGNPQRVSDMSNEKTPIFDPVSTLKVLDNSSSRLNQNKEKSSILKSLLDKYFPLPKEGSKNYELNLRTATRIRKEITDGKEDDFPTDGKGNLKTIDWYINQINKDVKDIENVRLERNKRALETKGELSQDEALRGPETVMSLKMKNMRKYLSHAFYLLNNSPESTSYVQIETPANILSTPSVTSGAAKAAQAEQAVNNKKASRVRHTLRRVDSKSRPVWNQEKELEWIKKVLPQLSDNDRVRVVKGLIRVGNQGALAWGQFSEGIITLSDIAAKGTTYHEAFHAVFNLLLDSNERQTLLAEAKRMYGEKSDLDLEEDMAEGFREYVMSRENRGIGSKILDFFKELFAKVTNWKYLKPSLINYYRMINEGKYITEPVLLSTEGKLLGKRLWHTSDSVIYRFEKEMNDGYFAKHGGSPRAIFFADRAPESQSFLSNRKYQNQYDVQLGNSYIVEDVTKGEYDQDKKHNDMQKHIQYALDNGYDSVIFKNMYDNMMYGDIYVIFDPMRIRYIAGQDKTNVDYGPHKFSDLSKEQWKVLVKKGWTEEQWNKISQEERDQAVKCIAI